MEDRRWQGAFDEYMHFMASMEFGELQVSILGLELGHPVSEE